MKERLEICGTHAVLFRDGGIAYLTASQLAQYWATGRYTRLVDEPPPGLEGLRRKGRWLVRVDGKGRSRG